MPIVVDPSLTTGTGVDLCAVFLNDADDLSDFLAIEWVGDTLTPTTTAQAEVRQLVNRRRLISKATVGAPTVVATSETYALTFPRCTTEQVAWLRAHVGQVVCVRDHKGEKFYGVYVEAPREISTKFLDRTQVRVTVDEVTFSEAV